MPDPRYLIRPTAHAGYPQPGVVWQRRQRFTCNPRERALRGAHQGTAVEWPLLETDPFVLVRRRRGRAVGTGRRGGVRGGRYAGTIESITGSTIAGRAACTRGAA